MLGSCLTPGIRFLAKLAVPTAASTTPAPPAAKAVVGVSRWLEKTSETVSYTHLTLPTKRIV